MTLALYPGSFDPFTLGHRELVARAAQIFDDVIVGIGRHATKPGFFCVKERAEFIRASTSDLPKITITAFDGLLFEYARSLAQRYATKVVLIRGLRPQGDFANEYMLAMGNRDAAPEIETLFLLSSPDYQHVSSSLVRELASHNGDISRYVHPTVAEAFEKRRPKPILNPFRKFLDLDLSNAFPYPFHLPAYQQLWEVLAKTFGSTTEIKSLLEAVEIEPSSILLGQSAENAWGEILKGVAAHQRLRELVEAAIKLAPMSRP